MERQKVAIEEWLIGNELDGDTCFFEPIDWQMREEDYLNDTELILVFEGGLHARLNYGVDADEFEDYVESFGLLLRKGQSLEFRLLPD